MSSIWIKLYRCNVQLDYTMMRHYGKQLQRSILFATTPRTYNHRQVCHLIRPVSSIFTVKNQSFRALNAIHFDRNFSTNVENEPKPFVSVPYSYAFGRSNNELVYKTINDLLNDRLANDRDQTAVVSHHEGISKTFSQLYEDVDRISKALHEDLSLQRGDVVGLWSCNTYNWIAIQFACFRLGLILCTINPFYRALELNYALRKGEVKAIFLPGKGSSQEVVNNFSKILAETLNIKDDETCHETLLLKHIISIDGESYTSQDVPSKLSLKTHALEAFKQKNGELDPAVLSQVSPDDPATIMFTSGTTGKPKGAYLSQFTLTNNALLSTKSLNARAGTSVCVPLPFFHSFAGVLGNIAMLAAAFQLVIPCLKYDVKQVIESIQVNNVTHMLATPTLVIDMLNYIKNNKIQVNSLQTIIAGAASMPVEIAHEFGRIVPSCTDFRIGYGATELGPCTTACRPNDTFEQRTETVGSPLDFVEIKVVDPATKALVKLGECGEIYSRGHNTMLGYWKDPTKTAEVLDYAGWYNTGDLGVMDENGFLKIVGRTKEMIIVGGENVYPREIEEILHTHPAIFDAHVIGVPDERKGEEICAWVKLGLNAKATEEELKQFCKDNLAYFKVPKYFLFVDSFPITTTGKAQKFIMREMTCKKLNLKENKN